MADENEASAAPAGPAKATRKRRAARKATTVSAAAVRHSYKHEAELLRVENERLRTQIARLQSQPASHEQSLILKTAETSFRAGMETGLLLQGTK